jgi:urease accessory protein
VILNTAGGLTGGDSLALSLHADAGTRPLVTTQACEKIYKSASGKAVIRTDIALRGANVLEYLPQPTILFDHGRFHRTTEVDMDEDSTLLALEACILGRTAMHEDFRSGELRDVWKIRRGGRLVFADALALTGEAAGRLRAPWGLGDARAYATIIYAAPDAEQRLDAMREALGDLPGAASAWNGVLLTRLVISDGYALMSALRRVLSAFREGPLPRSWGT